MKEKISAECHSDDRVVEVEFNAIPWFKTASAKQLVELADCNWKNDYPADAVAHYMAEKDKGVAKLFKYLEILGQAKSVPDTCGFECAINGVEAVSWLHKRRPRLAKLILSQPAS